MTLLDSIKLRLFSRNDERIGAEAVNALRWLEDETLNAALAEVRDGIISTWTLSRDPETRERAWLMLQQTNLFVGALKDAVTRKEIQDKANAQAARKKK